MGKQILVVLSEAISRVRMRNTTVGIRISISTMY